MGWIWRASLPPLTLPPSLPPSLPTSQPSFPERLQNGAALQVAVAVDFTRSNLQPEQPGSLHYLLGQPGR